MIDLEERLRSYAEAVLAETSPVTAEEVRRTSRHTGPMIVRALALAVVVLVLVGITAAVTADHDEGATNVAAGPSTFPLTLDGHRDWNLAVLNGEISVSNEELKARYTDEFVAAVSPERFRSTSEQLIAMAPWRILAEVERRGEDVLAVQLGSETGEQARLTIHRSPSGEADGTTILLALPCADPVAGDTQLDEALAESLRWVTELLESRSAPTEDELRQRFAPSFLSAVPPERLRAGLPQLRALGPYRLRSFEGPPSAYGLTARVGVRTGEEARLSLSVEPHPPHRITGFSVFTQPPCRISPGR